MRAKRFFAYGFSWRKRSILRQFLGEAPVCFIRHVRNVLPNDSLLLWGNSSIPDSLPDGVNIVRVEDGFLRSVGLGADLVRPVSWVMDNRGLYYDATRPSELECILQESQFDEEMMRRAAHLRHRIVERGLSKYNVGSDTWIRPSGRERVILVPGQVESDASIKLGAGKIRTNIGLLRKVREENPDAYVVYKPHPDVQAGLRAKGKDERQAGRFCDEVVEAVAISALLFQVDEVHVLTSLAGFEALLRGKTVTCHGQPFYSGWGLTNDKVRIARRTKKLNLDALVAGVLIQYPRYISRSNGKLITPEQALDELAIWRERSSDVLSPWHKIKRIILRHTVGVQ